MKQALSPEQTTWNQAYDWLHSGVDEQTFSERFEGLTLVGVEWPIWRLKPISAYQGLQLSHENALKPIQRVIATVIGCDWTEVQIVVEDVEAQT